MPSETSTIYQVQSQQLPAWYEQYLQSQAGRAEVLSSAPYQAYGGQRVAGLTPEQLAAYQGINNMQGSEQPYMNRATELTNQGAGADPGSYADPYYGTAIQNYGQQDQYARAGANYDVAGMAQPYMQSAMGLSAASAGQPWLNSVSNINFGAEAAQGDPMLYRGNEWLERGAGTNTAAQYDPYAGEAQFYTRGAAAGSTLDMANPYFQQAAGTRGLSAAQPYLDQASRSFPEAAGEYMSPYTTAVTDRIADLGARNLSEKLLPAVSDDFIRAGQYGSTGQRDMVGRAVRDTQESILGEQARSLESGYATAANTFGQDAARQAGLAGTAGGLSQGQGQLALDVGRSIAGTGGSDPDRQLAAAGMTSNIGSTAAGLSAADAARQVSAGGTMGQLGLGRGQLGLSAAQAQADAGLRGAQIAGGLTSDDANRGLSAAQLAASIGQDAAARQFQAGSQFGQIGTNTAAIGSQRAATAGQTADRQIGAGNQMANIGGLSQDLRLRGYAAQEQAGMAQQGQAQRGLDTQYQTWQEQQQYPWQQLNNYSGILRGTNVGGTTSTQGQSTQPGPSTASQVAGLGIAGAGLASSGLFRAKGGAVKKPKAKASYGRLPRRGLGFMMQEAA